MSNIYLTPSFLEEQRRNGVQPDTIADFISAKVPEFKSQYVQVKMASKNDPRAIEGFLNWKIYGTAKPDPSIMAQPLPEGSDVDKPPEPGFFGRIAGRIGEAGAGVRESLDNYNQGKQGPLDTVLQSAGHMTSGVLAPATETIKTASDMSGLTGALEKGVGAAAQSPVGQMLKPAIQGAADIYGKAKQNNPQQAKTFESVGGAVMDAAEVYGSAQLAKGAVKAGKKFGQGVKEFMDTPPQMMDSLVEKQDDAIQALVQPKADKKLIQERLMKNPQALKSQKAGMLKKGAVAPIESEKALADTARTIEGFGQTDDVIENADIVWRAKADDSNKLLQELQANDAALSHKEINSAVNNAIEEVAKDFPGEEAQVRRIGEIWKNSNATNPGKLSGHWSGRIGFDGDVERRFGPAIFEKGTAKAEAVRAVRQTVNDLIDKGAKGTFKPQLKRISHMYEILENLSTKIGPNALESGASKLLKKPLVKQGLGALGIGAAGYAAAEALGN